MNLSPEVQSKMLLWRQKCIDRTITPEDLKEAMALLREDRHVAAAASKVVRAKAAKAAIPSADDLLGEIGDIE